MAQKIAGAKKMSYKGTGYYAVYRKSGIRRKNKLRKIARHLEKYPHDLQASRAWDKVHKSVDY